MGAAKWSVGFLAFFLAICVTLSTQAQTIHVLIAADTNIYGSNQYGLCAKVDLERLRYLFRSSVGSNHLNLHTLAGSEVSEESILRAIDGFECDERDGLVFMWAGHGQYDSRGHHFQLPGGGKLYRATVVEHVRQRGAGTDVVLSSSCNVRPAGEAAAMQAPLEQVGPEEIRPIFRSLFLDARGLVDINGANTDQCTVGVIGLGTSFFVPFQQVVIDNLNSRLSWSQFAPRLKNSVEEFFRDHYPDGVDIPGGRQYSQTPKFYSLPGEKTHLPEVLGLTANDVILSINDRAVSGGTACIQAINQSGDTMEFTVRDSRDGNVWRMRATLRRTSPRFGIHVVDAPGGGALVTSVHADSPATFNRVLDKVTANPPVVNNPGDNASYRLEPGDVILSVNGVRLRNLNDFWNTVKGSPTEMRFTIRDRRSGREVPLTTRLRSDASQSRFGVVGVDNGGDGVRVHTVRPDSPGTRCERMN